MSSSAPKTVDGIRRWAEDLGWYLVITTHCYRTPSAPGPSGPSDWVWAQGVLNPSPTSRGQDYISTQGPSILKAMQAFHAEAVARTDAPT